MFDVYLSGKQYAINCDSVNHQAFRGGGEEGAPWPNG